MTDEQDASNRTSDSGGDPSAATVSGSASGARSDRPAAADTASDLTPLGGLNPEHDQPAEGGVEQAEDGDGDAAPGR